MLTEVVIVGGLVGAVAGLLGMSIRPSGSLGAELSPEAALRAAMLGPEGRDVAREFRRRGIIASTGRPDSFRRPFAPLPL